MRHLQTLSEAEMVAAFLKSELTSERFGVALTELLRRDGRNRRIVEEPDVSNEADNDYRRQLLGDHRGYRQDRELFEFFPDDVTWHRYRLERVEVFRIRYVDYSYWNELSGGTRLALDAARNVRQGKLVFGQTADRFREAVRALQRGVTFPELILIGRNADSELVVLEGHLRLTAYALAPDLVPHELTAIIGFSPRLGKWLALPGDIS